MTREIDAGGLTIARRLLDGSSAFRESALREAWVRHVVSAVPPADAARALEVVCIEAERGDPTARELLVSLVGALLGGPPLLATALREEAEKGSHLALGRLLRKPTTRETEDEANDDALRIPDYGRGRPLTLGERRALARRPDRKDFDKLLRDPHPMVIINLLANPRLTAEDLLRVAARKSTPAEILVAIAKHPRWSRERRVRVALVLNARTPDEIAVALVSLLNRTELRVVMQVTTTPDAVRVAARELSVRRPPVSRDPSGEA